MVDNANVASQIPNDHTPDKNDREQTVNDLPYSLAQDKVSSDDRLDHDAAAEKNTTKEEPIFPEAPRELPIVPEDEIKPNENVLPSNHKKNTKHNAKQDVKPNRDL